MQTRVGIRVGFAIALGLLVGCGGGGEDGGCAEIGAGFFHANVGFSYKGVCAGVSESWTMDFGAAEGEDRSAFVLYVPGTASCCPQTWTLYGSQASFNTWDLDDVFDVSLCYLVERHGYQQFDITNATATIIGDIITIRGDVSVETGTGLCLGTIAISGVP